MNILFKFISFSHTISHRMCNIQISIEQNSFCICSSPQWGLYSMKMTNRHFYLHKECWSHLLGGDIDVIVTCSNQMLASVSDDPTKKVQADLSFLFYNISEFQLIDAHRLLLPYSVSDLNELVHANLKVGFVKLLFV